MTQPPSMFSVLGLALFAAGTLHAQEFRPEIPHAWNDRDVAKLEVPLVQRDRSPRYLTAEQYYELKVRTIYRSYPVYAPGRAPAGYFESLKAKEPEVLIFDALALHSKEDWIRAGEAIFDDSPFPIRAGPDGYRMPPGLSLPITKDGIIPSERFVIRQKGLVEQSNGTSCAACHTRVLPDGTAVKGGQIDFAVYPVIAGSLRASPEAARETREFDWITSGAPWLMPREEVDKLTNEELARRYDAMIAGVLERQGTSSAFPVRVPSLVGVADIKYFDATGLVRHRSIGDLMRYDIVNTGMDLTAHFGDFQPRSTARPFGVDGTRFSDEQLYALALYLYSLKRRRIQTRLMIAPAAGNRSSSGKGARGVIHLRCTRTTSSLPLRASRSPRTYARPTTLWMFLWAQIPDLRRERDVARGSIRCHRCVAFGIAVRSVIAARRHRWTSGSTRRD